MRNYLLAILVALTLGTGDAHAGAAPAADTWRCSVAQATSRFQYNEAERQARSSKILEPMFKELLAIATNVKGDPA